MGSFFQEIKRRKVFRVAAIYAVVAWGLIQVADTIAPLMNLPESATRLVLFLLVILFPIALFLAWAYEVTPDGIRADTGVHASQNINQSASLHPINYIILVLVLLAVGFQVADRFLLESTAINDVAEGRYNRSQSSEVMRVNLSLGESRINPGVGMHGFFDISPDGQQLVYSNLLEYQSRYEVKVRNMTTGNSIALPPSGVGQYPLGLIFSPDGDRILVSSRNRNSDSGDLYAVATDGGGAQLVAEALQHRQLGGFAWLSEDTAISLGESRILTQINVYGGITEGTPVPTEDNETVVAWPSRIGNTSWMLYSATGSGGFMYDASIKAYNFETEESRTLIRQGYNAKYTPSGHIVFMREGDLWAAPLDLDQMELSGGDVMVEQGVEHHSFWGLASYVFSKNGRLIFRAGSDGRSIGNTGSDLSQISGATISHNIPLNAVEGRFSPAGDKIVFSLMGEDVESDVAVYNITDQTLSRRTFSNRADRPLWSPDGNQIIYREQNADSSYGLWIINAEGSGQSEQLLNSEFSLSATSYSPDGSQVIFSQGLGDASEVKILEPENVESPIRNLLSDGANMDTAEVSPDGRWIVHGSDELGPNRAFVRPFPNVGEGKWLVSELQGREAHWGSDGSLYFISGNGSIYKIEVNIRTGFNSEYPEFGTPQFLVRSRWEPSREPNFDISPDSSQILYRRPESEQIVDNDNLVLVENWFERLDQLAPVNSN